MTTDLRLTTADLDELKAKLDVAAGLATVRIDVEICERLFTSARELARLHALADETPLTPDLLQTLGFTVEWSDPRDGWRVKRSWETDREDAEHTDILLHNDGYCIVHQGPDEAIRVPRKILTVGQLLRLLDALGIDCAAAIRAEGGERA